MRLYQPSLGRAIRGARSLRALLFVAVVALAVRALCPAPPPKTLAGLAAMLGSAIGGTVQPGDIVWEPSPGILVEFFWGRRVLFLGRERPGAARDLYRARVRVTLEGRPIAALGVHNLTATPLGDEQCLVIYGDKAAFATASYGRIETITLFDLAGRPRVEQCSPSDVVTGAITNWQETGDVSGIGRMDVSLDVPQPSVLLALDAEHLLIGIGGKSLAVQIATGAVAADSSSVGAHTWTLPALHKRPILWAVDTVRAEVGPEPVAAVEATVFNARDLVRRSAYALFGPRAEQVHPVAAEELPPPPEPAKPSAAARPNLPAPPEVSVWPPPPIVPIWKKPDPGEGAWEAVTYPWLKRLPGNAPPYFYRTSIRPDPDRPYAKVLLVAMDTRQLDLDMEGGVEDPKPLTGEHGSGKIPRDPKILNRVVGAFNGAFKTTHGEYGMMVHRRVLLPPKPGAASVVLSDDHRIGLGTWGQDTSIPPEVVSYRQNLEPLVQDGKVSPSGRTQWGWQLSGTSMMTERSGICVTATHQLYYLWGDEVSALTLGKAMILAGCTYGMHLDMNPHHTGFVFAGVRSIANKDFDVKLLTPLMEIWPERYLEFSPKDFFYLMLRDPKPQGDVAWTEDAGTQPGPSFLSAVWHAMVQSTTGPADLAVQVELFAFDVSRVRFRIAEGQKEGKGAPAADLGPDEEGKVIAVIGVGSPRDAKDGGRATGAKLPPGALATDEISGMKLFTEAELAGRPDPQRLELPLVLDGGQIPQAAREPRSMRKRGAVCVTPYGHAVVAMATADSDEAAAQALAKVGCTRAVALDRGAHRQSFLHRAGTGSPPLPRYDESVVYVLAAPMQSRAYRWASK